MGGFDKIEDALNADMAGEKYETYLCEYPYDGRRWMVDIKATSWDDARARVKALAWTELKGRSVMTVPVPMGDALHRFWKWLRG